MLFLPSAIASALYIEGGARRVFRDQPNCNFFFDSTNVVAASIICSLL